MKPDRTTYTLTLRPMPGCKHPIMAIRALLKRAKRDWLLACIDCRPIDNKQKD